ncbi:hypothetical protein VTK26DRAFT_6864 [Humicola hyalothermophila]
MSEEDRTVVVSAPGKVLLGGGYIVLERKHTGLVFGLSARIHVLAQEIPTSEGVHLSEIVVQSPQFLNATWRYGYHAVDMNGGIKVTQLQSGEPVEPNHFVETTLTYVLSYIAHAARNQFANGFKPASLIILADNDYYSRPKYSSDARPSSASSTTSSSSTTAAAAAAVAAAAGSSSSEATITAAAPPGSSNSPSQKTSTAHRPRFRHFGTTLSGAHKTGLGSSAALVTALTAALLSHYLHPVMFDLTTPRGRRILHNLAQIAHCSAQGKIGSGFDVASAVYGSGLYRRFSPSVIGRVVLPEPGQPFFAQALVQTVNQGMWDCEMDKSALGGAGGLPRGVVVRMVDVDCGTQTVGMVKRVHEWKAARPEAAERLYDEIQACVDGLARVLREGDVDGIRGAMRPLRECMRRLGNESGVPIEPQSQTEMLDELEKVPGVLGSVVPGAGGYDAAAVVMRDDEETERLVKEFLRKWGNEKDVRVSLMRVKGETEGARKEDLREFKAWIS